MRLQSKLISAFVLLAVITLGFSLFASWRVKRLGSVLYEVGVVRLPSIQALNMMSESLLTTDFIVRQLTSPGPSPETHGEARSRYLAVRSRFEAGWRLYAPLPQTPEENAVWQRFIAVAQPWQVRVEAAFDDPSTGQVAGLQDDPERTRLYHESSRLLGELTRLNYAVIDAARRDSVTNEADVLRLRNLMLMAGVAGFLAAAGLGIYMSHAISAPVVKISQALEKVKRGDFDTRLDPGSADEVGEIGHALNRMLEALRTGEARLQVLSDNLPDTVMYQVTRELDGTMRFLYVSAGIERVCGISREDLLADSSLFYERLFEEDARLILDGRKVSITTQTPFAMIARFRRADGAVRLLQLSSAPRQLPDGRTVWDGVGNDITEKETAAARLRESETRFRAIFDRSADAIGIAKDGKFVLVNAALPPLFGYTHVEEIIGRPVFDLVAPRSHAIVRARVEARAAGNSVPLSYELEARRRDGSHFAMEVRSSAFKQEGESFVIAIHRDISERQRSEQQIRSSNRALKTIRECNQHLVHANHESELLQNLCRVFAQHSECSFAWAASSTIEDPHVFVPTAQAGGTQRELGQLKSSWAAKSAMHDVDKTATPARWIIAREFSTDAALAPWRDSALRDGCACCLVLPLRREGEVLGFLVLESEVSTAFDHDELTLFAELADDVAFGLDSLRERNRRAETEAEIRALLTEAEQGRAALLSILEDQKIAEDALHGSEERFRSAMHHSAIGMALGYPDGRCFEVNDAFCQILGYSREELISRTFGSITHPDDVEESIRQFGQLLAGLATTYEIEKRYLHKAGHAVWAQINVSLVRDPEGHPLHSISQIQDISERLRTAAAREEILARLRLALRAGHLGTFRRNVLTGEGSWDEQTFDLIGRSVAQGAPTLAEFLTMVHPDDRSTVENAIRTVPLHSKELSYAFRMKRPDGTLRHFVTYAVAETTREGRPEWITGVFSDISDLIEVQERLKVSAQRLELALTTSEIGVWRYDLRTKQAEWDERMYEIFGVDRRAPVPDHDGFTALLYHEDRARFQQAWDAMLAGGPDFRVQLRLTASDGSLRHIEGHAVLQRDGSNRPEAVLGVNSDITEIVHATAESARLREQLQQAQKMETLGTMAAGVAHDFNNLLTGINGFVGLAASSLPPGHEAEHLLKQALRGAVNARDLVRRILDFSRGRGDQAQSRVDVGELIRDTAPLITAALPGNVSLSVALTEGVPAVLADPGQLQQVLLNLCINGSHAIGAKSGQLTIGLKEVALTEPVLAQHGLPTGARAGNFICLSVADTGSGMDERTRRKIFEPFFTTKKPGVGTGLGLSIVRDIVTAHRGGIELESELGAGTIFRIYLPPAPAVESRALKVAAAVQAGNGARILVVDDEPSIVMVLRLTLQRLGYSPEVYTAASDAWKRFAHMPDDFDLLMVDQNMPDITGHQFIQRVRAVRPDIPVILMSGELQPADAEPMPGQTGVRGLKKPFELPDLTAAVRTALVRRDSPTDGPDLP